MPVAKYFCNRQVGTAYFPNLSYHFDQFKSVFMDWVRSITPIIASASFLLTIDLDFEAILFDVLLDFIHQERADAPPTCCLSKVVIPQGRCG